MNAYMKSRQGGFTLVELAVVLVIIGLLLGAVLKGQEMIQSAQAKRVENDIKQVEVWIQQHKDRTGRLPGDCNQDGIIGYDLSTANSGHEEANKRALALRLYTQMPTRAAANTAPGADQVCPVIGDVDTTVDGTEVNVPWNELRYAGMVRPTEANRTVARLNHEDFVYIGHFKDPATNTNYNAIVIYNLPVWMARQIASSVNGFEEPANRGRFRHLNRANTAYHAGWTESAEEGSNQSAAYVNAIYFFDRIPTFTDATVPE